MSICDGCIHEKACRGQYQYDSGYFYFEEGKVPTCFEDTIPLDCAMFEDKSYILRPKYRIGDHVWTLLFDEKQQDIPIGIGEFAICEIRWDDEEFMYYDSEYFLYEEHHLFGTKEEAEVFLNEYLEV